MELQVIQNKIYEVRGQKVMLDFDLAELYGSETKRLKEAVRRNLKRFPSDFMFELTKEEFESLRSQIASSNKRERNKSKSISKENVNLLDLSNIITTKMYFHWKKFSLLSTATMRMSWLMGVLYCRV
jgi:hypothetical protein